MSALERLATFEVSIGGVLFKMHRRSTAIMLDIGDARRVFGLVAGANAKGKEPTAEEMTRASEEYAKLVVKTWQVALIAIAGEPVNTAELSLEEMHPVSDALFNAFMGSGLTVDPSPDS